MLKKKAKTKTWKSEDNETTQGTTEGVVELPDTRDWTKTGWFKNLGQEKWAREGSCTEICRGQKASLSFLLSAANK